MANVVVFHSALGMRPAINRLGDMLRQDGHRVWTPDLYGGQVFSDVEAGAAERDRIGIPQLMTRAAEAVSVLPADLVYLGFSMGTGPAQLLAATRPGARGAVLVQGVLPPDMLPIDGWPDGVSVQLHVSPDDPCHDQFSLDAFVPWVPRDMLELHQYPHCGHLFSDEDLEAHDEVASGRLLSAVRQWLTADAR